LIFGVGTDIVAVARMRGIHERHGERIAERILAPGERAAFHQSASPANFLAKRFAAKEAFAKALGTGFTDGLGLTQIAVGHDQRGRPEFRLTGRAAAMLEERGIGQSHLSIADEREYAVAFVTLVKGAG